MVEHFVGLCAVLKGLGLAPTASQSQQRGQLARSSRPDYEETIRAGVDGCWHFQIGIPCCWLGLAH